MNKKFWVNKRVLITGFEGFLGSNLIKALLKTKAKVIGLDIKVFRKETLLCSDNYKRMVVYKGSVTNYKLLQDILRKHFIDVVFHLAAEAIVEKCLKNPLRTFSSNIRGTWNVLEACRDSNTVKAIVVASSDKAYGSHKKLPYKECAPLQGDHPYDVSKSCTDLLCNAYYNTYGVPVCVTRCGNIYGFGDYHFSRIVPDTIKSALKNKTLVIRSNGKFTRDYIYVEDIVSGYITLAENAKGLNLYGEAFNFSNEKPISVLELVRTIYTLVGKNPDYNIMDFAKHEIKDQYLSSKKARQILKWRPRYTLKEGLQKTIEWYKKFCR